MTKNNIRSFRFSDKTLSLIENFEGDTLSAQFENMVDYCYNAEKRIDKQIEVQTKALESLTKQCRLKREELARLGELERAQSLIFLSLGDLMQKLRSFDTLYDKNNL